MVEIRFNKGHNKKMFFLFSRYVLYFVQFEYFKSVLRKVKINLLFADEMIGFGDESQTQEEDYDLFNY